jgi:hypothetical protein
MTKFITFAVDMSGTPEARYDLVADEAKAAAQEAGQYLVRHRIIEVWSDDHRRVARVHAAGPGLEPTHRRSRAWG